MKLLHCDRLVLTIDGLKQLTQDLIDRTGNLYRNRKVKRSLMESEKQRNELLKGYHVTLEEKEVLKYDPNKPLKLKFKILEDYLQEYENKKEKEVD